MNQKLKLKQGFLSANGPNLLRIRNIVNNLVLCESEDDRDNNERI